MCVRMQPLTACNFIDLVQHGFYNGLLMHQVFADDVNLVSCCHYLLYSICLLYLTKPVETAFSLDAHLRGKQINDAGARADPCGIYM